MRESVSNRTQMQEAKSEVTRFTAINGALLVAAALTGAALTGAVSKRTSEDLADAEHTVEDATGERILVRDYARIVSTSTIADQVLVEIIDPSRLLAVSGHTLRTRAARTYRDKIGVERARDIETIIELRPDIVFINNFIDRRQVERLKDAGLNVFDLGEMRGLETLLPNIRQVAAVLGVSERGEELADELERDLAAVSVGIPNADRRRGLYVGIHGDRLYGGTAGTSFHDVLTAAGLVDVAAEAGFDGWPAYTNEQLISLDPPWIITNPRTEQSLCRHPGFHSLSACQAGQVRGVETHLLTDPGLGIVEAARTVHAAVYGDGR
jgi:iron complex transport system substrate-binding protein